MIPGETFIADGDIELNTGRATVTLRSSFPVRSASVTDLLERPMTELAVDGGNVVTMQLRPFEVVTLRLSR